MARVSRKRAATPAAETLELPYRSSEAPAPPRVIERVDVIPAPVYGAPLPVSPGAPFGAWLLRQDTRDDWVGMLAKGAKADRGFPKAGDPDAVRKRLGETGAEADMFEAVDDAEAAWLRC